MMYVYEPSMEEAAEGCRGVLRIGVEVGGKSRSGSALGELLSPRPCKSPRHVIGYSQLYAPHPNHAGRTSDRSSADARRVPRAVRFQRPALCTRVSAPDHASRATNSSSSWTICTGLSCSRCMSGLRGRPQVVEAERNMAEVLFEHLWGKRLTGDKLRAAARKAAEDATKLKWYSLIRPFDRIVPLRERVGALETWSCGWRTWSPAPMARCTRKRPASSNRSGTSCITTCGRSRSTSRRSTTRSNAASKQAIETMKKDADMYR